MPTTGKQPKHEPNALHLRLGRLRATARGPHAVYGLIALVAALGTAMTPAVHVHLLAFALTW